MKILFCGDIVGKSGRESIKKELPSIMADYSPDIVIANGENAAHGFGITQKIMVQLLEYGIDIITLGNHAFDNKGIMDIINSSRIIRPLNYSLNAPGRGVVVFEKKGFRIMVVNLLGTVFMGSFYIPPITYIQKLFSKDIPPKDRGYDAIVMDFHAEATAEKQTVAKICDGKISLVAGTHTHVATNDAQILPNGTAYISDVGMCGNYNSILGMEEKPAINRLSGVPFKTAFQPKDGPGAVSAVLIQTHEDTGLTEKIQYIIRPDPFNKLRSTRSPRSHQTDVTNKGG